MKILVVDDDIHILKLIARILEKDGYEVTTCLDAMALPLEIITSFNLIILDVMMPKRDGFEVCKILREQVDCPILFVTAKTEENDVVYGLGMGADDYIQKPFGSEALRARVGAHLRREKRDHKVTLDFGSIRFNLSSKQLFVQQKEILLTSGEYKICEYLARNKGHVFSREQIYEAVFGYEGGSNDSTIATHIKNIRLKLEKEACSPIQTVWGIGYKWEVL